METVNKSIGWVIFIYVQNSLLVVSLPLALRVPILPQPFAWRLRAPAFVAEQDLEYQVGETGSWSGRSRLGRHRRVEVCGGSEFEPFALFPGLV